VSRLALLFGAQDCEAQTSQAVCTSAVAARAAGTSMQATTAATSHVFLSLWPCTQVAVCSLLPLAFCLLGDTAEFYIAPIMAHVSQAIPKMRPRFAGGTRPAQPTALSV
jgi:hypothetical protein